MLKEVDKKTWQEAVAINRTSIFNDPDYLEIIAQLHQTKIKYWIFFRNEKAHLGFATHIKGKSIIVPDHFSYSSFWFNDTLTDFSFFDTLNQSLQILKKNYRNFVFSLPPQIQDIRAFNLNDCLAKVNYTYINATDKIDLRNNNKVKWDEASKFDLKFIYNNHNDDILKQQLNDFQYFGYSKAKTKFYKNYFNRLIDSGYLRGFGVYLNGELKASSLIIIDEDKSRAYNLLLSNSKQKDSTQSSTFLYLKMMEKLKELGINSFDLYGANMLGIANFKSGFRGELCPHYMINYSATNIKFKKFKRFVRLPIVCLKKIMF